MKRPVDRRALALPILALLVVLLGLSAIGRESAVRADSGRKHAGPLPVTGILPPGRFDPAVDAQRLDQTGMTLLSENFESATWPSGTSWRVFDDNPAATGEYYWSNRCSGHHSNRSAWAVGSGANGRLLNCGSSYPHQTDSWMVYGPLDLSAASEVELAYSFYVDSECEGAECATKSDELLALWSRDGTEFTGEWWAGNWTEDPTADATGWVDTSEQLTDLVGASRAYIAFRFRSDASVSFPVGAKVDDVRLSIVEGCERTASLRSVTTDRSCYAPGASAGVFVDVGNAVGNQAVRVQAALWSGDVIWSTAEVGFTAPGSRVVPLSIPADLFPGDYELVVSVYDAADPNCLHDRRTMTLRVDPTCGTATDVIPVTATPTRAPTATATFVATLCPGDSATEVKPVHVPPAPGRADLLFAFDTTGSMGPVLDSAKSNAVAIMADLARLIPDIQFAVVDFRDYPLEPFGESGDWPYRLRQSVTGDRSAVVAAIAATSANQGGDAPEAYSRTLHEAVADGSIGWRPDARRFVVMFGDDVPHDDDLNTGLGVQPVNPGGSWCGATPSCRRDPGRDGLPGTADDLDLQTVLGALAASRTTLLYVVSGGGSTNQANMTQYWRQWARWNGSGGDAVALAAAAGLPAAIQDLVSGASRRISRLDLKAFPPEYQSWLTSTPPAFTDLEVPAAGLNLSFNARFTVPYGTAPGTYRFAVKAIGDGAVYAEQGVVIHVPTTCASPTPTPTTTRWPSPTATATATVYPCPPVRPDVTISCPPGTGRNHVRNHDFERYNRSWGEFSRFGREIVSSDSPLSGSFSAHFKAQPPEIGDEWLFQYLEVPADVTAASFYVEQVARYAAAVNPPPITAGNFFRVSLYSADMRQELMRLWEFDTMLPVYCPIDSPTYNLSPSQLDRLRGQTVVLVLRFYKVTPGWEVGVLLDGVVFNVCAPSPPCTVSGDKTASPNVVPSQGEAVVAITLQGAGDGCAATRAPADVALVIDRSGSMEGRPLSDAQAAARDFVDLMEPGVDQTAVISFADAAAVDQVLSLSAGAPRAAIARLTAAGDTNMEDALLRAQAELTSPRHRAANQPVIVLLSDGRPTAGGNPLPAAASAKAAGTRIFTIGLGKEIDDALLKAVASAPSDYFAAPSSADLAGIYRQISSLISGGPATNVTVVDRLSGYVTLIPGSFTGPVLPEVSADNRTLTWRLPRLGLETVRLTYRVRMTSQAGTWPTNDAAVVTYTDSNGKPAGLTLPIPQVTVLPAATGHPDAMCRDHPGDGGDLPSTAGGASWWDSPDIWVRRTDDRGPTDQTPLAGQTNYIQVRVRNRGSAEARNVTVRVFDAVGGTSMRWPDDWMPMIGEASIPSLAAGASTVVSIPWRAVSSGHTCFLARIAADADAVVSEGWVPFDNNLCQRNVQVVDPSGGGGSTGGGTISTGTRGRGHGYVTVTVRSPDIRRDAKGRVTFSDPAVFNRWLAAGGTADGGTVDPATRSVGFGAGPVLRVMDVAGDRGPVILRLNRLAFEAEELTDLNVTMDDAAGGSPTLYVDAEQGGRELGGVTIRPRAVWPVLLPALLRGSGLGAD
ncbi:MAG TPA: VWA domain-containing protein [Anaerolineae bacterium]|nr:VWA domain-containing protein [Anaerolineae bacterium]